MDEIVLQAMHKWPNVPHCYGWLGLDARGRWCLRDADTQLQGVFPQSKGEVLEHEKLVAFIGRNYTQDDRGCWYFQNGPQRVFVELEAAPWVLRIHAEGAVQTHTGQWVHPTECVVDRAGRAYLATSVGVGLVHSLDTGLLAERLERGDWPVRELAQPDPSVEYGYVCSPQALQNGALTC